MIELSLKNKKGKVNVKSSEVKNILESRPDFEYVQDISATINQERIMVYDCQLSRDIFNLDDIEENKKNLRPCIIRLDGIVNGFWLYDDGQKWSCESGTPQRSAVFVRGLRYKRVLVSWHEDFV